MAMLATHRDQENLVHSHQQASIKQQPKTPGTAYPKTPGHYGRNDENAPNTLVGKAGWASGARLGGTSKLAMGKATDLPQSTVTPMGNRSRAPLGNKTTNAKARTAQAGGIKNTVGHAEKTQPRQTSARRLKKQSAELQPVKLNVQPDISETPSEELPKPEYAPPRPIPLPYESDLLPPGGLTFNGLRGDNLFKGYYEHFHNPVDENGVSRMEKKFNDEFQALMRKAEERNHEEIAAFDWNPEDVTGDEDLDLSSAQADRCSVVSSASTITRKQAPTTVTRRAASALAVQSGRQSRNASRSNPDANHVTKKSLSSMISSSKPAKSVMTKPSAAGNSKGEVASRTTLGYSKGRSASTIVHMRGAGNSQLPFRPAPPSSTGSNLTVTPARLRQAAAVNTRNESRPQFMSIFDEEDSEDLPAVPKPVFPSDDEDDEFELKLTI